MRLHLCRISVVVVIIGLALIGRGLEMGNAEFLWTGVSLSGLNAILMLVSHRHDPSSGTHRDTASTDASS